MSFSFFKASRPKTPQELVKAIKDSLMALDSKTVAEVKALEKVVSLVHFHAGLFFSALTMNFSLGTLIKSIQHVFAINGVACFGA